MRSLNRALFMILLSLGAKALALESNHLKQFHISQCYQSQCFFVNGNIAFLSVSGDVLTASRVSLLYRNTQDSSRFEQKCATFRFDMRTQFLTCDNRGVRGEKTLFIDSKFKISNIERIGKI